MKIGDNVVRNSYGKDITFKIINIKEIDGKKIYILKGMSIRLLADSYESDLSVVDDDYSSNTDEIFNKKINKTIKKLLNDRDSDTPSLNSRNSTRGLPAKSLDDEDIRANKKNSSKSMQKDLMFGIPGRILHIDGDSQYLDSCLKVYKQLNLIAYGEVVAEKNQPDVILELVRKYKPDIVVLTGHDALLKGATDYTDINSYRNSKYFVDAVIKLREYQPNYDDLIIFAGACQSFYERLLESGANFASSPNRVLIHCLDPVFICEKLAYTPIDKFISIGDILNNTITGIKGIGGLQTRGKYRQGYPKSSF